MKLRFHRQRVSVPKCCGTDAGPSIHILRTEDEFREAVERAAEFHQRTATMLRARSEQYEALLAPSLDHCASDQM